MKHIAPMYFLNPSHKLSVCVVGVGGTGSQVLTCLARINATLLALDHPGLHVTAIDSDTVSESNLGRQLFSKPDVGRFKTDVLIERINRFYGLNWESAPHKVQQYKKLYYNIIISCVDSVHARKMIKNRFKITKSCRTDFTRSYYWMDFGNGNNSGQVILSDGKKLKDIFILFPEFINQKTSDDTPSCSVAAAILKQDLFTNGTLAMLGCDLLWKLLHDGIIEHAGLFMNLETLTIKPIKIK